MRQTVEFAENFKRWKTLTRTRFCGNMEHALRRQATALMMQGCLRAPCRPEAELLAAHKSDQIGILIYILKVSGFGRPRGSIVITDKKIPDSISLREALHGKIVPTMNRVP